MDDPILEYNILDALDGNEERLTQRHISQKLGRSVSSVNFALRLLAVKGYIKISGANPRNLRYNLTPRGILQKTILAYDFLKRQSALYEEVRKNLLEKLRSLSAQNIRKVAVYGWTPFTEAAVLSLISSGIQVTAIYADYVEPHAMCSRIPLRPIGEYQGDCEVLVLMQPLPGVYEEKINTSKLVCFPGPDDG